ncbi:hypothetical protein [Nonlabens dokdonensis]|uniref:hypothetical protein n=1 Tax=Nonlabens dokdonensis TaxID=328515 RepID=UPI0026EEA1CE|nr:hypothetical protein [Nonlabens dokdonensis]
MQYQVVNDSSAIVYDGDKGISFEILENPREFNDHRAPKSSLDWDNVHETRGPYRLYPYGIDNRFPLAVRDIVKNNNEAPGILKKKMHMIWGKGPALYKETFVDGLPVREWVNDTEIMSWLKTWDYKKYLTQVFVDYNYLEAYLSKFIPRNESRFGARLFINKLENVCLHKARQATLMDGPDAVPTHVIESTLAYGALNSYNSSWRDYPLFDFYNLRSEITISYTSMYTFCQDVYAVPDIMGTLKWMVQSNNVPILFDALQRNGISAKYHVTSPMKYWDKKRKQLQARCENDPDLEYSEHMLDAEKSSMLRSIAKTLAGLENTGKFWHSEIFYEEDGVNLKEYGWDIKEIPQNMKDLVESQISISNRAGYAISTGLAMSAALANVDGDKKASSGSSQFYAASNHHTEMDEMIIFQDINRAIAINFPDKDINMGCYQVAQKREEEITPSQRRKEIGG